VGRKKAEFEPRFQVTQKLGEMKGVSENLTLFSLGVSQLIGGF
jgi:hypothetical protein